MAMLTMMAMSSFSASSNASLFLIFGASSIGRHLNVGLSERHPMGDRHSGVLRLEWVTVLRVGVHAGA